MANPLRSRTFACPILLLPTALTAELILHPTLPDRVVETRGAFVVEYSSGQEAWAEVAFQRLGTLPESESPIQAARDIHPPAPGSAGDFRARRDIYLAAVAAQVGLDAPRNCRRARSIRSSNTMPCSRNRSVSGCNAGSM